MASTTQIQAYLSGVSRRYEKWRRDNALTDTIEAQQANFTFKQFVQTESKLPEEQSNKRTLFPEEQPSEEEQSSEEKQSNKRTLPLLEGIREYLKSEHVLLIGSPGVGKSSVLWHCLNTLAKEELDAPQPYIPVLIQLKQYRDSFVSTEDPSGLLTLIRLSVRPHMRLSISEVDNLLLDRRFILLLDGLNEMPASAFNTHLCVFRDECQELEIPVICSTRSLSRGDLGIQRKLEIQPLSPAEANRFLQECLPEHQEHVRQLFRRDNRELSRTPFVLWMLYHLLKETGTLAETLGEAFRHFFRYHFIKYKEDAPVTEERRQAWNLWLEELAFNMLNSSDSSVSDLVISREDAENLLSRRFGILQGNPSRIHELEKYHFLTPVSDREITFQHQLIQEYYAAECLLDNLYKEPQLLQKRLEQGYTPFQICCLNDLKWTEPLLIMMSLLDAPSIAIQVTRLALETDLRLGARIAGATSKPLQKKTIKLLLENDYQDSLKIWLLQQSRSSEAIPFLLDILHNGDSNHRWRAARALAKFDKHLVKDHLKEALTDEDPSVRRIAAVSLKELCSIDIAKHLCHLLNNDEDWLVPRFMVGYLGDLQDEEAIECLKHALNHPDSIVRKSAAEHLGRRVPQQVISILEKRLEADSESKKIAIHLLGETVSSLAFPPLMRALSEDNWIIRSNASDALGHLSIRLGMSLPDEVADRLIDVLQKDTESSVRSGAAIHLGFTKTFRALSSLTRALTGDRNKVVRHAAAVALGRLQQKSATDALIGALKDEEYVVEEVIRSLRLTQSSQVLPYVKKFLKSKNSKLRKEAVLTIGLLGDSEKDTVTLYKFLKDKSFPVRLCSAYALSQFSNRKGLPTLKEALKTGNKDARKRALYGLENFDGKVGLTTIASVSVKDDEYSIRKEAIRFLKRFSYTQEVRGFLKKALESKNENTVRNAIEAVKVLGYPEMLKPLRQIIKDILVVERPLEAKQVIQARFGFYDFEIYKIAAQNKQQSNSSEIRVLSDNNLLFKIDQTTQNIDKRISSMANESKNVVNNSTFNAPVNFGNNPTGDFIDTQNNFNTHPEVQNTVTDLQTLVTQLQEQYPSVNAESEALTIIDAEFSEIKQSHNHKLMTLRQQLLNPERHLQAGKATLVEVLKHFLEESVWAKAAITYFDKLSETPN